MNSIVINDINWRNFDKIRTDSKQTWFSNSRMDMLVYNAKVYHTFINVVLCKRVVSICRIWNRLIIYMYKGMTSSPDPVRKSDNKTSGKNVQIIVSFGVNDLSIVFPFESRNLINAMYKYKLTCQLVNKRFWKCT
jgi:hypothetical protein